MNFVEFLIFTFFSSIEYIAIFFITFCIYRIRFHFYLVHIIFACLILSYISYTMRLDGLITYAPIIQMILLILFMWLLLQFQVFYAAIMIVTGSLIFGGVQTILVALAVSLDIFTIEDLKIAGLITNMVALSTSILLILIGLYIKKKNWGFTMVPHSDSIRVNYGKRDNLTVLFIIILSIVLFGLSYYFMAIYGLGSVSVSILLFSIFGFFLIIFLFKLENSEDDDYD